MISTAKIHAVYEHATTEFIEAREFQVLVSGRASGDFVRQFLLNVFRTHYLSAHIVALCFAALPSNAAALLKENLLEEMGHSADEPPHSALLLKLAEGIGCSPQEIDKLIDDARRRVAVFCATRVPLATLREICLAVLLETLSFEFMLSRCSGQIATALREHYGVAKAALKWFELHSEVDIRHAEEGLTVIEDYLAFHQIGDPTFDLIQRAALGKVFSKHYFPAEERAFALPVESKNASLIEAITIYKLKIPFHQAFHHATQRREESDAVIVRIKDASGQIGYGEALPRPYVTGETTASMIAHLRGRLAPQIFAPTWVAGWATFELLDSCRAEWTRSHDSAVSAWNAAFCAVELALLDWSLKSLSHFAVRIPATGTKPSHLQRRHFFRQSSGSSGVGQANGQIWFASTQDQSRHIGRLRPGRRGAPSRRAGSRIARRCQWRLERGASGRGIAPAQAF